MCYENEIWWLQLGLFLSGRSISDTLVSDTKRSGCWIVVKKLAEMFAYFMEGRSAGDLSFAFEQLERPASVFVVLRSLDKEKKVDEQQN